MSKKLDDYVRILRELLKRREQAIIEADGAWNPFDELFTDELCDAIEYICDVCDNES